MPRYFFHLLRDANIAHDNKGSDMPDFEAAHHEAGEIARRIMTMDALAGGRLEERTIWVRDEDGKTILMLNFRDVEG